MAHLDGAIVDRSAFADARKERARAGTLVSLEQGVAVRDTVAPIIDSMSPPAGSSISRTQAIGFHATDNHGSFVAIIIEAIHSNGLAEVVFDSNVGTFQSGYAIGSSHSGIAGGAAFTVARDAGWPATGLTLRLVVIDGDGNFASPTSYAFTVTNPAAGPLVANFSPAPGTPISRSTPLEFDVTDVAGIRRIFVQALFGGVPEVVHDGDGFAPGYSTSSRIAITGGFHYVVVRRGGWPSAPTIKVDPIDDAGNET